MRITGFTLTEKQVTLFFENGEVKAINHPKEDLINLLLENQKNFLSGISIEWEENSSMDYQKDGWEIDVGNDHYYYKGTDVSAAKRYITHYLNENTLPTLTLCIEKLKSKLSTLNFETILKFFQEHNFPITVSGKILAMRRVMRRGTNNFYLVDNYTQKIPQTPGTVVEIPRELVNANPNADCSVGLHICSYGYLNNYGLSNQPLTIVAVNPEDVVSLSHSNLKARVCKYQVLCEATGNVKQDLLEGSIQDKNTKELFGRLIQEDPEFFSIKQYVLDTEANGEKLEITLATSPETKETKKSSVVLAKEVKDQSENLKGKGMQVVKQHNQTIKQKIQELLKKMKNTRNNYGIRKGAAEDLLDIKQTQKKGWKVLGLTQEEIKAVEKYLAN